MRHFVILAVALVLLAAQAGIVGLGPFAPQVSAQYRSVFIEHKTLDWVTEP